MRRYFKAVSLILLALTIVLGNIPLGAMMVCVHANDIHGGASVHLHYGEMQGHPCDDSPAGLDLGNEGEGRRHFSLAPMALNHVPSDPTWVLSLLTSSTLQIAAKMLDLLKCFQNGYSFDNPPFIVLDTAFTHTTVLII